MSLLNLQDVEMADAFRADGKIYVVVAIISVVVVGLLAYLFTIDRKVGKLEKEIKK
jgi:CcmD family protein